MRIGGTFIGAFGVLALVLAAMGVYGVTSYTTNSAPTRSASASRLARAGPISCVSSLDGDALTVHRSRARAGLAFGATRFMKALLVGITPTDAVTFVAVGMLLGVVVLVACFIPARRAMRVDPMQALRYE